LRVLEEKTILKTAMVTTEILCNKCGESCMVPRRKKSYEESNDSNFIPPEYDFIGLIEVEYRGGYESEAIPDGDQHQFSLCEPCLAKFMATFKIPSFQYSV